LKMGDDEGGTAQEMEIELEKAVNWFRANKMSLNVKKTKLVSFNNTKKGKKNDKQEQQQRQQMRRKAVVRMDGEALKRVGEKQEETSAKYLGVKIDDQLSWRYHVQAVTSKVKAATVALLRIRSAPMKVKKMVYHALAESHMRFAVGVWGGVDQRYRGKLESAQNSAVRVAASNGNGRGHTIEAYKHLGVAKLQDIIASESLEIMGKSRAGEDGALHNIKNLDRGRSRASEYSSPRPVEAFLRTWPSYSIPLRAGKLYKEGGRPTTRGRNEAENKLIQEYSLTADDCIGKTCHCQRIWARKPTSGQNSQANKQTIPE
jgi:hypothetical protein